LIILDKNQSSGLGPTMPGITGDSNQPAVPSFSG
jgi:hypothetical protein